MSETPAFYGNNPIEMIIHLRKYHGITVIELAEKMGVSPSYIACIELGEIKPTKEQLEVLRAFIDGKL